MLIELDHKMAKLNKIDEVDIVDEYKINGIDDWLAQIDLVIQKL